MKRKLPNAGWHPCRSLNHKAAFRLPTNGTSRGGALFYALLALLSLASCHQSDTTDGPTTASGIVLDQVTHQPVPFATVNLLETPRSSGNILTGSYPSQIQQVQADAQGHFDLSFQASGSATYALRGSAPGFLEGSLEMQPRVSISPGVKNTVNVPLAPEGYLRVRVFAANPQPFAKAAVMDYYSRLSYAMANTQSSGLDTTLLITMPGGASNLLEWWVFAQGTAANTYHTASLFFPAHDTADFTIQF